MSNCLIIFAKEPKKGKVKTRLETYLSKRDCLNLYKAFLQDTLDISKKAKCKLKIIAYESNNANPKYLKEAGRGFKFYRQKGRNLGQRMHNAFEFANLLGASKSVIIGTDAPTLPDTYISEAFLSLSKNDIVLGPALDGGYYLIGLKKPCLELFKKIKWSTKEALTDTIKNAKLLRKKIAKLSEWYDVDDKKSFLHLIKDLKSKGDKNTAKWTRKLIKI